VLDLGLVLEFFEPVVHIVYCLFLFISPFVFVYCIFLYVCIFSFDATILVNKDV